MVAAWTSESGDNIGGALRSTDGGASWFNSSTGLPAFFRSPRLVLRPPTAEPHRVRLSQLPVWGAFPDRLMQVQPGPPPVGRGLIWSEMLRVIQPTTRCSLLLN